MEHDPVDDLHGAAEELSESEADTGASEDVSDEETSWITWFCSIRGNEFFCEVDEEFIHDEFNLTGLSTDVPYFEYALDTILDVDSPHSEMLTEEQQETVDAAAELLYGLIHARYILTSKGLNAMYEKYQDAEFGRCPRVLCEGTALLPVGQSDLARKFTVNLYCPRCNDIYLVRSSKHASIDGAYFGTTFPHLFLMTFPNCVPPPPPSVYVPRVFGFRIRRDPLPDDATDGDGGEDADEEEERLAGAGADIAARGGAGAAASVRSTGPAGKAAEDAQRRAKPLHGDGTRTRELAMVAPTGPDGLPVVRPQDDFFDDDDDRPRQVALAPSSTASASMHDGGDNVARRETAGDGARPAGGEAAVSSRNGVHTKPGPVTVATSASVGHAKGPVSNTVSSAHDRAIGGGGHKSAEGARGVGDQGGQGGQDDEEDDEEDEEEEEDNEQPEYAAAVGARYGSAPRYGAGGH